MCQPKLGVCVCVWGGATVLWKSRRENTQLLMCDDLVVWMTVFVGSWGDPENSPKCPHFQSFTRGKEARQLCSAGCGWQLSEVWWDRLVSPATWEAIKQEDLPGLQVSVGSSSRGVQRTRISITGPPLFREGHEASWSGKGGRGNNRLVSQVSWINPGDP